MLSVQIISIQIIFQNLFSFLKDLDAMLDLFVEALEQLFVLLPVLLSLL